MRIKTACCSVIGRGHIKNNTSCQDYSYVFKKDGFTSLAVCDGAGSCKYSKEGAEVVAKSICNILCNKFDNYYNLITYAKDEGKKMVAAYIVSKIHKKLNDKARILGADLKDLSSTLLFVAIKNGKYICGHIGDGVLGASKNGNFEVISTPDNGEYANSTFFITGDYAVDKLRIHVGSCEDIDGFILMTDGSSTSLYDKKNNKLARACDKLLNYLTKNSEHNTKIYMKNIMRNLIIDRTLDDCSIGFIFIKQNKQKYKCFKKINRIPTSVKIQYNVISNRFKINHYNNLYDIGIKYYKERRFEEALSYFEELLTNTTYIDDLKVDTIKKCIINIHYNLGRNYHTNNDFDNAQKHYLIAKSKCFEYGFHDKVDFFEEELKKYKNIPNPPTKSDTKTLNCENNKKPQQKDSLMNSL
jgi:hypothetical protein